MGAFPTSIAPKRVRVRAVSAVAQFDNPLDLSVEVQDLGGFRWEIDIEMQPMSKVQAAAFGAFAQAHRGGIAAFTFDLTPWAAGWSPAPGVRNFIFATPDIGWDADTAMQYGFTFTAIEDV